MKTLFAPILLLFFACSAMAQGSLGVRFDTTSFEGLPGLHSFASA